MRNLFRNNLIGLLVCCIALAAVDTAPLRAHHAPSGWRYPDECCRDDRDCQMIHPHNVEVDEHGFIVTLQPGEHRHAPGGGTFYLQPGQARRSGDGEYHVCIHVYESGLGALCIYLPDEKLTLQRPAGPARLPTPPASTG